MNRHLLGLFLIVTLVSNLCVAQRNKVKKEVKYWRYWQKAHTPFYLSARIASNQFWGELHQKNVQLDLGGQLGVTYLRTSALSGELDYSRGQLKGRKSDFFQSNFRTQYQTLTFNQRLDIFQMLDHDPDIPLHLFVYAGVGLIFFKANAYDIQSGELVRFSNHTDNSSRTPHFKKWGDPISLPGAIKNTRERIIPLGINLEYNLDRNWKVGGDIRLLLVRTDKLDATSGFSLENPEEASSYSNTLNDFYTTIGCRVTYRFLRK